MPKNMSFFILTLSSLEEDALPIQGLQQQVKTKRISGVHGRESHQINICIINGKIAGWLRITKSQTYTPLLLLNVNYIHLKCLKAFLSTNHQHVLKQPWSTSIIHHHIHYTYGASDTTEGFQDRSRQHPITTGDNMILCLLLTICLLNQIKFLN